MDCGLGGRADGLDRTRFTTSLALVVKSQVVIRLICGQQGPSVPSFVLSFPFVRSAVGPTVVPFVRSVLSRLVGRLRHDYQQNNNTVK